MYVCICIQNWHSFVITVSKGVDHFKQHQVITILTLYQRPGPTGPIVRAGLLLPPVCFHHKGSHTSLRCQLPITTAEYNRNSKNAKHSRTALCSTTYTADLIPLASAGRCVSSWGQHTTQAHSTCPFPLPLHSIDTACESYCYLIHNLQVTSTSDRFFNQIHPRLKTKAFQ